MNDTDSALRLLEGDDHGDLSPGAPAQTSDEKRRFEVLRDYGILDTAREPDFDNIAVIASALCDTPIAMVSFVAEKRQWFKAEVGLGVRETALDVSICRHAIQAPGIFTVPDTTKDPRFSGNALVTGEPHLRFYAGAVLETQEGVRLGTVCVLDYEPRELTDRQRFALNALARQVMSQLELRRAVFHRDQALADRYHAEQALRQSEEKLRLAMAAGQLGAWELALPSGSLSTSPHCKVIFGRAPNDPFSYEDLIAAVHPEDREATQGALARSIERGNDYDVEYRALWPDGTTHWITVAGRLVYGASGDPVAMVGVATEITQRKNAEERQDLLVREMHHRVQNTLATVQAIMASTARSARTLEEFQAAFSGRLISLSRTHTLLMQERGETVRLRDLLEIELSPYADGNVDRIVLSGPDALLPADLAVPISMAFHELTTNAAKYGALSAPEGRINVAWELQDDGLHLEWTERDGPPVQPRTQKGFGSTLIERVLAAQTKAQVTFDFPPEGLRFSMNVPLGGAVNAKSRPA